MNDIEGMKKEIDEIVGIKVGSPKIKSIPALSPATAISPEALVEEVLTKWTGPIVGMEDYESRKNKLNYLKASLGGLTGSLRKKGETAVSILEERIKEYEAKSLPSIIKRVEEFLSKGIQNDEDVGYAMYLIDTLEKHKVGKIGYWLNVIESYIQKLRNEVAGYYRKIKEQKIEVGSPEVEAPDWVKGFKQVSIFYTNWMRQKGIEGEAPVHTVDSKYCKVQVVVPGKEYLLGFEDRDEGMVEKGYPYKPDWDYDEPVLRVRKTDGSIEVKVEKYGGWGISRILYNDQVLFDPVGGWFKTNVGKTKTIGVPGAVTPPSPPTVEVEETTWDKVKKFLPWGIAFGALFAGGISLLRKK